jgi:hypothetical protein
MEVWEALGRRVNQHIVFGLSFELLLYRDIFYQTALSNCVLSACKTSTCNKTKECLLDVTHVCELKENICQHIP